MDDVLPATGPTLINHVAAALAHRARTGDVAHEELETAWQQLVARRAVQNVYELRDDWGAGTRLLTRAALVPLLEQGDADRAIGWLERLRPLATAAQDEHVADIAQRLRAVWRGRRADDDDADVNDSLVANQTEAALEAELVDCARLVASSSSPHAPPTASDLAAQLSDQALHWIVALPSGAWTITLTKDDASVRPIDRDGLERAAGQLTAAMRLGRSDWREAAAELDGVLGLGGDRDALVLLPVGGAVEDVCFGALPSLRSAHLRTCWSGAHWLSTREGRHTSRVTIAAAGVDGSAREVDLLHAIWPDASTLREEAVTSANVQAALASDDLVHLGAHGHMRRDNPLLSTLECTDGPLYGYELARADRVAGTILLWSCALGGARMPADVGIAGWPTLLAQLGCNALIAAPGALPSEPAPDLAVEVHRGLAQGEATDVVLTRLRELAEGDPLAARAAAMLAVHGAG
jgi:hypothetical protein